MVVGGQEGFDPPCPRDQGELWIRTITPSVRYNCFVDPRCSAVFQIRHFSNRWSRPKKVLENPFLKVGSPAPKQVQMKSHAVPSWLEPWSRTFSRFAAARLFGGVVGWMKIGIPWPPPCQEAGLRQNLLQSLIRRCVVLVSSPGRSNVRLRQALTAWEGDEEAQKSGGPR